MCELCDGNEIETKKEVVLRAKWIATRLRILSEEYRKIADGRIKPHTEEMESVFENARKTLILLGIS